MYATFAAHLLLAEEKEQHVEASQNLVEWANKTSNFLQNIVTYEPWCFQYDLSTKCQTADWHGPGDGRPQKYLIALEFTGLGHKCTNQVNSFLCMTMFEHIHP